jgi:hypothetical protein
MSEHMALNPRRPAFRMPWTGESENPDEQAAHEGEVAASAAPEPDAGGEAPAAGSFAVSSTEPVGAVAPDAGAMNAEHAAEESGEFLRNLVDAMRGVAETSREASVAELREAVESRITQLQANAAEAAEELRRRSELDVSGISDWERSETERIREEAERRRGERRMQLERQLTEAQAAVDRDVESARGRLAGHEEKLTAFFADLSSITDPAAFVMAAKKMPQAPELTDAPKAAASQPAPSAAPPPSPPIGSEDPRLAVMAMSTESTAPESAEPVDSVAAAESAEPAEPAADERDGDGPSGATDATDAADATDATDANLARRLAQLDARLSGAEPAAEAASTNGTPAPAPAAPAAPAPPAAGGTDTSTAIVVKGLGSFGAITSFKQALERVDGIRGVTLSLGPTGEFVYRASHAGDFDLEAAIRTIEGDAAAIDRSDGSLLVTVSRSR